MSSTMMADAPRGGWISERLKRLFGPRQSVELHKLDQATQRLEAAATALDATATKMQGFVDPLGELVIGLRDGPAQRKPMPKRKKSGSPRKK